MAGSAPGYQNSKRGGRRRRRQTYLQIDDIRFFFLHIYLLLFVLFLSHSVDLNIRIIYTPGITCVCVCACVTYGIARFRPMLFAHCLYNTILLLCVYSFVMRKPDGQNGNDLPPPPLHLSGQRRHRERVVYPES